MAEKRFLHIMPDDKFLDYFINQSEDIAPGTSAYWVKLDKTAIPQYVKSNLIDAFPWNFKPVEELVEQANQFEKVFLHSFTLDMADFILKLKPSLHITWMFWGYEGYKYTADQKQWFLPATLLLRKRQLRKNRTSLFSFYTNLRQKYISITESKIIRKILSRIDRCATWVRFDYEMIRFINPKMTWADYNYFSFDQLGLHLIEKEENNYSNIWVGNSGALTNNHVDALLELKKMDWKGNVYMPLAYGGSNVYTEEIIRLGKKYFGSRFHPITDFLPLSEYQRLINKCGLIWMNHIRQQAAGNILAALYMGKAVILRPQSNLYKTLKLWDVNLYSSLEDFKGHYINADSFNRNKEIVETHVRYEHTLRCVKHLYMEDA